MLLSILVVGCEKTNDVAGPGDTSPPDTTTSEADSLALTRTFSPLLADGTDQVTMRALVVDAQGKGLDNVGVAFTATHGTIEPFATSDRRGEAAAVFTGEASATDQTAHVTAQVVTEKSASSLPNGACLVISRVALSPALRLRALKPQLAADPTATSRGAGAGPGAQGASGGLTSSVDVPLRGITVSLEVDPPVLPADGITEGRVLCTLVETTRRVPLEGRGVRFGATHGVVSGSAQTDGSGTAAGVVRAGPGETASVVTAYYGRTLTAQTTISFSEVRLTLTASAGTIVADGVTTTTMSARLVTQQGNPVVGARIDFRTTNGTIASPIRTDSDGIAAATLRSAATPGTAEVTAQFGTHSSQSSTVEFIAPPATATLLLEIAPATLPADGTSRARLTGHVFDNAGRPVVDGTRVEFSVVGTGGRIIDPITQTRNGIAEAEYVAGDAAGLDTLRATSGTASATVLIRLTPLGPNAVAVGAEPTAILADGFASSSLTAIVSDLFGHPVAAGTEVQFSTTLGIIEDVTPTDAAGRATARLRATRFRTGRARVTVTVGEASSTVDLAFVSDAAAHIEAVRVDPPSIGVRGASDHETATITFEAQDRNGIPVDTDHAVNLSCTIEPLGGAGPTDATLYPTSARTNENGQAAVTVNAGFVSGTVGVEAVSGSITSEPVRVAIHGDKPDPAHFSVAFEKVNVAGLVYFGIHNRVTAYVGDQHGNPVPDSTTVWFRSAYGLIQGSAGTDDHGTATVDEVTAGPAPIIPGGDGLVEICAQTVSKTGTRIDVCGDVLWSGSTIVEVLSPGFDIPNGGWIEISFRVRDANFNPLTGGTQINITSTRGDLGGDTEVVLPDTQSRGYTFFSVVLSDDAPDVSEPGAVTVTIQVRSQNGNRSAFITGTMD
jgi:adhesin/invasin